MKRKRAIQDEFAAFRKPAPDYGPGWGLVTPTWPADDQTMLCRSGAILRFAARWRGRWYASPGRLEMDAPTHCLRRKLCAMEEAE